MIEVKIKANTTEEAVMQMQSYFGGEVKQRWGEFVLQFCNTIGEGTIRCLTFDWGVSLMEFDATFYKDIIFVNDNSLSNPIHFSYVSQGQFKHRFTKETEFTVVEQYHSAILVGSKGQEHVTVIPKNQKIIFNNIRVVRQEYLKKRLNNVELLNEKLNKVFIDDTETEVFSYYSPIHLRMEDHVAAIRNNDIGGMTRILQIEGEVYQLLSMHISRHDKYLTQVVLPPSLLKDELKIIKKISNKIMTDPAAEYSLEHLSRDSGLSQAKLQEGFKFLYTRTVTEYIRQIRLEASRDLMNTTDLNISQIVYSIGFTSRSYFSKIFREKYGMTPHEFKKQVIKLVEVN